MSGRYDVSEGFGELRVPVIEGMPFAELLQFEGAYRYSCYNLAGPVSTYKYSGEWAPTDDFRFRASFERAVRAPNINELFSAQGGFRQCRQGSVFGSEWQICWLYNDCSTLRSDRRAGHQLCSEARLECPAGQCTAETGGNPSLTPEVGYTRTAGIVFTPTFIDGFNASIDYYNIKVDGFITGPAAAAGAEQLLQSGHNPAQIPTIRSVSWSTATPRVKSSASRCLRAAT